MFTAILTFGPTWPPKRVSQIYEREIGGSTMKVSASPDGRLHVHVFRDGSHERLGVESPPLSMRGPSDVLFSVEWDWTIPTVRLKLFDSIWFLPGDQHELFFEVPSRPAPLPTIEKLTDGSVERAARTQVVERLRSHAHFSQAEDELRQELQQLRDLLAMLPSKPHHVRGIANIVRKLIANKPGLLQIVAGKFDAPLRIYASSGGKPPPEIELPPELIGKLEYSKPGVFGIEPAWGRRFETDLDAWLVDDSNFSEGMRVSNLNVVKGIADKIGAHNDLNKRTTVETLLKGLRPNLAGATDLHSYVGTIGTAVMQLSENVLAIAEI